MVFKKKINIPLYTGDFITLGINTFHNLHRRIFEYSGIIIAKKNNGSHKTILLRTISKHICIERYFLLYSPEIIFIKIRYSLVLRRSKLYYLSVLNQKL
jgi:ribosomal protein L19